VLVVEDDQDTRQSLVELLVFEGYEAAGAADGPEALALLQSGRFAADVVVLDVYMPGMNGQQVRAALQSDPRFAHLPIILCTGTTPLAAAPGAFDTLQKPFDVDALLAVVQRGCSARKPPERALSA
jgi:CheY-like chemotaxis protein